MAVIEEICREHGLFLIEDAAEAHGARYRGRRTGGFGDVSCFSFYANKIITTGEGGMLLTDDPDVAQKARRLKDLAFTPEKRYYHRDLGFNYRMTNIQAAIGVAQMKHVEASIESRRRNAALYQERLRAVPGLRLPSEPGDRSSVYWYYSVVVEDDFGVTRDQLMGRLSDQGIESRNFFFPVHRQPIYPELEEASCPVAEFLGDHGINLPSGNLLQARDIDRVTDCIRRVGGG